MFLGYKNQNKWLERNPIDSKNTGSLIVKNMIWLHKSPQSRPLCPASCSSYSLQDLCALWILEQIYKLYKFENLEATSPTFRAPVPISSRKEWGDCLGTATGQCAELTCHLQLDHNLPKSTPGRPTCGWYWPHASGLMDNFPVNSKGDWCCWGKNGSEDRVPRGRSEDLTRCRCQALSTFLILHWT